MSSHSELAGYFCTTCKQFHSELPISYGCDQPDSYLSLSPEDRPRRAALAASQCVIDNYKYFIRGLVEIPILGLSEPLLWGIWASVWKEDFEEMDNHWHVQGREKLIGPYRGRLNNSLSEYPETLNLKCTIQVRPVGERPLFYIDEPDHPLAIEQRQGISLERVQQIASKLCTKNDRIV
jgi:hypothetical protein